jgi:hypothetical protein
MPSSEHLPTREEFEAREKILAEQEAAMRSRKPRREDYGDEESFEEALGYQMSHTGRQIGFIMSERERITIRLRAMSDRM